jgi:protein-tyrosine-phosphatase
LRQGEADLPGAILFVCSRNAARSAMAAALLEHLAGPRIYVTSAGVSAGEPDPFAVAVMAELAIDMSKHRPASLAGVHETGFDLIVALAPEAHDAALDLARGYAVDVDYWPTPDPSVASGSREQTSPPTARCATGFSSACGSASRCANGARTAARLDRERNLWPQ